MLPYSLRLTLTTKPQDCINLPKIKVYESSYLAALNKFLHAGLSNIEARQHLPNSLLQRVLSAMPNGQVAAHSFSTLLELNRVT